VKSIISRIKVLTVLKIVVYLHKNICVMKHLLITIVLAVFVATRVGAETVTVNGLTYLLVNQEAAVIAGHDWVGELVIPSEISYNGQSFTVSMIYCEAFTYCETLTRVTIPKTIREIMNYIFEANANPFSACKKLEAIEVEAGSEYFCSIDGVLFSADTTSLYVYPAGKAGESYAIPASVERIRPGAFRYSPLVTVQIPNSVTRIDLAAFSDCTCLETASVPEGITEIPSFMYYGCKNLKEIVIPEGVTHIGGMAFELCSSLTSISLPEGLKVVDGCAFSQCRSLLNAVLPSTLSEIDYQVFSYCSSLSKVIIPEGVMQISEQAFYGCTSLRTLDIPKSVTALGSGAFTGCRFDALVIRGCFEVGDIQEDAFEGMDVSSVIYVQPSEIEKFKKVYQGTVLPLTDYVPSGLSSVTGQSSVSQHHDILYDLQGRRLTAEPKHGVYIKGGKLRVK
jgi:hypothetical protein